MESQVKYQEEVQFRVEAGNEGLALLAQPLARKMSLKARRDFHQHAHLMSRRLLKRKATLS